MFLARNFVGMGRGGLIWWHCSHYGR